MKSDFAEAVERIRLWLLQRNIPTKDLRLELVFRSRPDAYLAEEHLYKELGRGDGSVVQDLEGSFGLVRGITVVFRWPPAL